MSGARRKKFNHLDAGDQTLEAYRQMANEKRAQQPRGVNNLTATEAEHGVYSAEAQAFQQKNSEATVWQGEFSMQQQKQQQQRQESFSPARSNDKGEANRTTNVDDEHDPERRRVLLQARCREVVPSLLT